MSATCPPSELPIRPALARTLDTLQRRFGAAGAIRPAAEISEPPAVIPTGFPALDEALGIGGLPRGRIVDVFGPEGSGKSTLCLSAIGQVQRLGGQALYIDAENSFDLTWARRWGIDPDRLFIAQPDNAEEALEIALALTQAGIELIVIDSLAALAPRAEIDCEVGLNHGGLMAALTSQALRKLVGPLRANHTLLLLTNQLRLRQGVLFGSPEVSTGGRALRHYAAIRLDLRRVQAIKRSDCVIGSRIRAVVKKNKLAPPFRRAEFELLHGGER